MADRAFKCPARGSIAANWAELHCKPAKNNGPFCGWFDCKNCHATWDSRRGTWYRIPG